MANDRKTQDDWNDCPQGELSRMVQRLDASQVRARTKKLYQTGLLSMLLVAGGVVLLGSLATPRHGGITCTECRSHFAAYHGHMIGSESLENSALRESLATHLAQCEPCQKQFNQIYPGVLKNAVSITTRPAMDPLLPLLAMSRQPVLY